MSDRQPSRLGVQRTPTAPPVPGVIETIADGLSLVLVYPLVALVPLAIDLALWSGLSISPEALLRRWADIQSTADSLGFESNVLPLAALGVPSLLKAVSHDDVYTIWSGTNLVPESWQLAAVTVGSRIRIDVAGHDLSSSARSWSSGPSTDHPGKLPGRRDRLVPAARPPRAGDWDGCPGRQSDSGGQCSVSRCRPHVMPLVGAALVVPAAAAAIYLMFTPDAIVLTEVGPLRAAYLSFNVVRRNFWPALGTPGERSSHLRRT